MNTPSQLPPARLGPLGSAAEAVSLAGAWSAAGFEQPATAARLAFHGAARVLPPRRANRATIREALEAVLSDPSYRAALAGPAAEIAVAGGVPRAADLIEARLVRRAAA